MLAAVTALVVRPAQRAVLAYMTDLRDTLIGMGEEALGMDIRYASIGPSIFMTLDIRRLQLRQGGPEEEPFLSVSRLRISYSVFRLLREALSRGGEVKAAREETAAERAASMLDVISAIRLDSPVFRLEIAGRKKAAPVEEATEGSSFDTAVLDDLRVRLKAVTSLLPDSTRLTLRRGKAALSIAAQAELNVRDLSLDALIAPERVSLSAAWNTGASFPLALGGSEEARPFRVDFSSRVEGYVDKDFEKGVLDLRLPKVSTSLFTLKEAWVDLALAADTLRVRLSNVPFSLIEAEGALPGGAYSLSLDYALSGDSLSGDISLADCSPRSVFTPVATGEGAAFWKNVTPWLGFTAGGSASFTVRSPEDGGRGGEGVAGTGSARPSLAYSAELAGRLPRSSPLGQASFAVRASGSERRAVFRRLNLSLPLGDFGFTGSLDLATLAPNGTLSLKNVRFPGAAAAVSAPTASGKGAEENAKKPALNAEFDVYSAGSNIDLISSSFDVGGVELTSVWASIEREESALSFNIQSFSPAVPIQLFGSFEYANRTLEASLELESLALADMLNILRPFAAVPEMPAAVESVAENTRVTTEIFVTATTDFKQLRYNIPRFVTAYSNPNPKKHPRDILAVFVISGTNTYLELNEGSVLWDSENTVELTSAVRFASLDNISFNLDIAYRGFSYALDGDVMERRSLTLQGSYGLNAFVNLGGSGGVSGSIQAAGLEFPFRDQNLTADFLLTARYDAPDSWRVDIRNAAISNLATRASPSTNLRVAGAVTARRANLRELEFDDGRGKVSGSADMEWNAGFEQLLVRAELKDESDSENLSVDGSYKRLSASPDSGAQPLRLSVKARNVQIERFIPDSGGARMTGNLNITRNITKDAQDLWQLLLLCIRTDGERTPDERDFWQADFDLASLAGRINNNDFNLSARGLINPARLALEPATLDFGATNARLSNIRVDLEEGVVKGNAEVTGALIGRTINTSFSLNANFDASKPSALVPAPPANFSLNAKSDTSKPPAPVPAPPANFSLNAKFDTSKPPAPVPAPPAGFSLNAQFDTSKRAEPSRETNPDSEKPKQHKGWQDFRQILDSISGSLDVSSMRFGDFASSETFSLRFERRASSGEEAASINEEAAAASDGGEQRSPGFRLKGGPGDMLRFTISDSGEFYAGLSKPSPIRGTIIGTLRDEVIEGSARNLYIDLPALWQYTPPQEVINITGGFAVANLRIYGAVSDPQISGLVQGNNIRLDIPHFLSQEIGPLPLAVRFEGSTLNFGPVDAPCGEGRASVSGSFTIERWIPDNFTIAIETSQQSAIPFAIDLAGLQAHGLASGWLNLAMEREEFVVTGDLVGEDTEITMSDQQPAAGSAGAGQQNVIIDLRLHSGRRVECFFPSTDFPVIHANAATGEEIHITSDSLSGRFTLSGDVNFRGGEIFYFERSFYIKQGLLHFDESESRFEPHITARAETRDRLTNENITISLVINDQPLMSFSPTLEASPPLSQIEILSLMGASILSSGSSDNSTTSVLLNSLGDIASQFWFFRRAERGIRDFLHLDMFSIRTQILQNAAQNLIFRDSSASNTQTSDGEEGSESETQISAASPVEFGNYFDNTTITGGIYVDPNLFVQAMLALRYDDTLSGGARLNRLEFGSVRLEPELGFTLQTPLFDISWDIAFQHPETLFMSDNKITLSRRWRLR